MDALPPETDIDSEEIINDEKESKRLVERVHFVETKRRVRLSAR
jgi:hypothetical protein